MKKRLALATAFAFSIIPFTSFADHLKIKDNNALIELMISGDLSHRDLEGSSLRMLYESGYLNTSGADFSYANLKDTTLEGANLMNANFSNANLQYTNLADTNLTGADLSGATLVGTILTNANLRNATLNTFITSNNDLSNVDLTGADLSEAILFGLNGFADIKSCPDKMPSGWFCENNTFMIGESSNETQEETEKQDEDIDFDSITKADLPLKVYCPDRGADLIIREKKKKKGFVVKITRRRGERFFDGRKFRKAVKKFKKALENEC